MSYCDDRYINRDAQDQKEDLVYHNIPNNKPDPLVLHLEYVAFMEISLNDGKLLPETFRCLCSTWAQPEDFFEVGFWIECDRCRVWQHLPCMGFFEGAGVPPPEQQSGGLKYLCDQCAPGLHMQTIESKVSGRKIWEERMRNWKVSHAGGRIDRAVQGEGCMEIWVRQVRTKRPAEDKGETDIMLHVMKAVGIVVAALSENERLQFSNKLQTLRKYPEQVVWEMGAAVQHHWLQLSPPERDFVTGAFGS